MRLSTTLFICIAFLLAVIVPQQLHADMAPSGPALGIFIAALVAGAVLLGVAAFHIFKAPGQNISDLDFYEEEVVLDLNKDFSHVSCTFFVENRSTEPFSGRFYFPFIVDETHPFPEEISISYTVNGEMEKPEYEKKDNRILFDVTFAPEEKTILYVNYSQTNTEPKVTYVITSANDWNQPVEKAVFKVQHPAEWKNVELSYEPQTTVEMGGEVIHTIFIEDLAPDREIEVTWEEDK
jgi:hypothetical protein